MKKTILIFCMNALLFSLSCNKIKNLRPQSVDYHERQAGQSAHDLLSADKYTSLTVQIQYMPGCQLDPLTIDNLNTFLNATCHKPGGITITQSQINETNDSITLNQIKATEKKYRTAYTTDTTLAIYVLITDGVNILENGTINNYAGEAFYSTSICLFYKGVVFYSSTWADKIQSESAVIMHEFGHLMGLVNIGSSMQVNHAHTLHADHCNNIDCLMFSGGFSLKLDDNCSNDLRANGGK